jgi:Nucleotide modification associated domain 2
MKLYSYVVDHDTGKAPNPSGRLCTLACCRYSNHKKWKNVLELAEKGDWIVGLGGKSEKSAGRGKIVFAMRVTKTKPLDEYCKSPKFHKRRDAEAAPKQPWRQVLISRDFYYFGGKARTLPKSLFSKLKVQRGFRNHFSEGFIKKFVAWVRKYKHGKIGEPCWQKGSSNACHSKCANIGVVKRKRRYQRCLQST